MVFGFIGAFLFILVQLVFIIDFAHSWAEAWVDNMENSDAKGWMAALLFCTGGMYIGVITGVALLFVYYTGMQYAQNLWDNQEKFAKFFFGILVYCHYLRIKQLSFIQGTYSGECPLHEFFISINLILCIGISVLSILPKIQEYTEKSGLLQAGAISMYVIYLTWSALSNSPYEVTMKARG